MTYCNNGDSFCEDSSSYPSTTIMSVLNDSHPLWKEFNETSDEKTTHNHLHHHRHLHDHFRGKNSKIRSNQDMSLKVLNLVLI